MREECYNCDIIEHFTQKCHKLRKSQYLAVIRRKSALKRQQEMMIIVKKNSELIICEKESKNINQQHNSML